MIDRDKNTHNHFSECDELISRPHLFLYLLLINNKLKLQNFIHLFITDKYST